VARGKHVWRLMLRTIAAFAIALLLPHLAAAQGAVTVRNGDPNGNNYFSVNGTPRFLVFVSYFDGFDVPQSNYIDDLNGLRARGVDGIRILANWWTAPNDYTAGPLQYAQSTLFLPSGTLRSTTRDAMGWYLDRARDANMVVDLTLTAETVSSNQFGGGPDDLTFDEYRNAILDLVNFLRARGDRHVILDLQNEGNLNGPCAGVFPPTDKTCRDAGATPFLGYGRNAIAGLVNEIHARDPSRIVMVSTSGSATTARDTARDLNLDVNTWHDPRLDNWFQRYPEHLPNLRGTRAVYLQEPRPLREQPGLRPEHFQQAVNEAKAQGAAAWCFHTKASFHMNGSNLQGKLEGVERDFLNGFRGGVDATAWGIRTDGGDPTPPTPPGSGVLLPGQSLHAGQQVVSTDGRFRLVYQSDGNLVLYQAGIALWHSHTNGTTPGLAAMQGDGNFVIYNASGVPVWHTSTFGNPGAILAIQNDGNLVIYRADGVPIWASGTCCR
jgi:hypothetical protein